MGVGWLRLPPPHRGARLSTQSATSPRRGAPGLSAAQPTMCSTNASPVVRSTETSTDADATHFADSSGRRHRRHARERSRRPWSRAARSGTPVRDAAGGSRGGNGVGSLAASLGHSAHDRPPVGCSGYSRWSSAGRRASGRRGPSIGQGRAHKSHAQGHRVSLLTCAQTGGSVHDRVLMGSSSAGSCALVRSIPVWRGRGGGASTRLLRGGAPSVSSLPMSGSRLATAANPRGDEGRAAQRPGGCPSSPG